MLSIIGKAFAHMVLNRLKKLADRVYSESQYDIRSEHSTIDMMFFRRNAENRSGHSALHSYTFDLMSHDSLFKVLTRTGCLQKLLSMIQSFHTGMKGVVQFNRSSSTPFDVK